jgi:hypothetical protein
MEGYCNSPSVRVLVMAMATSLPGENESVTLKCGNPAPCAERPNPAKINLPHTVTETKGSS